MAGLGDGRRADEPTPLGRGRVDGVLDLDIISWSKILEEHVPKSSIEATLPVEELEGRRLLGVVGAHWWNRRPELLLGKLEDN